MNSEMSVISIGFSPIMGVMLGFEYHTEEYDDYVNHYFIVDLFIVCIVVSVEREE